MYLRVTKYVEHEAGPRVFYGLGKYSFGILIGIVREILSCTFYPEVWIHFINRLRFAASKHN